MVTAAQLKIDLQTPPPLPPCGELWTAKHQHESALQRSKRLRRAVDALREGALLPHEVTQEFGSEDVATALRTAIVSAEKKGIAAYVRKKQRLQQLQRKRPAALATLCGKRIFIDRVAAATIARNRLDDRLTELGAAAEPVRENADCFLVSDVTNPGQRVLWNVMLAGGAVVSVQFFLTGTGPVVAYASSLRIRRKVWFSEAFKAAHPVLMNIVTVRCAAAGVKWKVVPNREALLTEARRNHDAGRSATMTLVFLAAGEIGEGAFAFTKRLTSQTAPTFLTIVRRDASNTGMCKV